MNFAVVIGIEAYSNPEWNLSAAANDALRFAEWALGPGGVPKQNLRLLLSTTEPLATTLLHKEAHRRNITTTIQELQDGEGKGCERLYFYYAGHGVSAPGANRDGPIEPVIIPSDVASLKRDSALLIGFSHIMPLLKDVEPTGQFYFIDACRDFALEDFRPAIGSVGPWSPQHSEAGCRCAQYVLYSTSLGQRAYEESNLRGRGVFAGALMDALSGRAPAAMALSFARKRYEVRFPTLASYVQNRIKQDVQNISPKDWERYVQVPQPYTGGGPPDPILAAFSVDEIPKLMVRVRVGPSAVRPACKVQVLQWVSGLDRDVEIAVEGPPAPLPATFSLRPGDYALQASADRYLPVRQACEVYEPRTVDFKLKPGISPELPKQQPHPALPTVGSLQVRSGDRAALLVVRDGDRQIVASGIDEVRRDNLKPGFYRVQLVLPEGPVKEEVVEVRPESKISLDLTVPAPPLGKAQLRTLKELGIEADEQGYLHPSEHLGGIASLSLASLLGFAAFAAYAPKGEFLRLKKLGVQPLADLQPGNSGLLVLIGASGDWPSSRVKVSGFLGTARIIARRADGELVGDSTFKTLPGFPAAAQYSTGLLPGPVDARLDLPGAASTHYALACLPNRVTVLVVIANDSGGYEVQQYLLPVQRRDLSIHELLDDPQNIRRLELAQRYYANGQAVLSGEALNELLWGKWVDPLLGALAGYSLVRAGRASEYGKEAMHNMLVFFGDLPDSHVLAGLCDQKSRAQHYANALARGLPVFADGVKALVQWYRAEGKEMPLLLSETSRYLLPGSSWTAWAAMRPALIIYGGHFPIPPMGWEVLEEHREAIEQAFRAVGRIEVSGLPGLDWLGTGFLVADDVVMTADFIVRMFCDMSSQGSWRIKPRLNVRIDFLEEYGREADTGNASEFEITDVLGIEEEINLALLRISKQSVQGGVLSSPLLLAGNPPADLLRRQVYVVGYPARDLRCPLETIDQVFSDVWGVKRLQPGVIIGVLPKKEQFEHDSFTLGGNAGSPVIDLETGLVLGLHFGGRMQEEGRKRNFALSLWKLRDHPLIKKAGVRFA